MVVLNDDGTALLFVAVGTNALAAGTEVARISRRAVAMAEMMRDDDAWIFIIFLCSCLPCAVLLCVVVVVVLGG